MVKAAMALPPSPFSAAERALLRLEFMVRFGQTPRLADGIWLRVWRGGPQAGKPKVPTAVASMLDRGLVQLGPDRIGARPQFTPSRHSRSAAAGPGPPRPRSQAVRPHPPGTRGRSRSRSRSRKPGLAVAKPARPVQPSRMRQRHRAILPTEKLGRGAAADQAAKLPGFSSDRKPQQPPVSLAGMGLHTKDGALEYLTAGERDAVLRQADLANPLVRTSCMTLAYSGCRLSEALGLTTDRVDLGRHS